MSESIYFKIRHDFDKSASSMKNLSNSMDKASKSFNGANKNLNKFQKSCRNLSMDANRSANSLGALGRAMKGISAYAVGTAFAKMAQSALDSTEIVNMFSVALGNVAVSANETLVELSDLTGLDLTNLQQATGTFAILAKSMGLTSEMSKDIGLNTTKMAVDLSSLYNVNIDQVFADLKSGLIGQTETVYKYGMDLTEAALAQEALNLGIDKSVRNMSQAEKMYLRMNVMMRTSGVFVGDFGNTLDTAANQLRMLSENVTSCGRAIGSVFIPFLNAVVPYIRAFIMVVTELASILASLFGFVADTPKNVGSGLGSVSSDLDDVGSSAGGATGAVKDLDKALNSLGFDELNTINKDANSSGGGGGGGAGGMGGFDPSLLPSLKEYDMMLDNIRQKAMDIRDRIMEWLGFEQRVNEATGELEWRLKDGYTNIEKIRDVVELVGLAFLGWKIRNALLDKSSLLFKSMTNIKKALSDISGFMALVKQYGLSSTLTGLFGKEALMAAGWAAALAICVFRFKYLWETSDTFRKGLETIGKVAKSALGWIGNKLIDLGKWMLNLIPPEVRENIVNFFNDFMDLIHGVDLDLGDVILTLGGLALLFTPAAPIGAALLIFEGITVAIRGIGYAASDCVDEVDVLGDASEETQKKMQPMLDRLRYLDNSLSNIKFTGKIIDDETVNDVSKKAAAIRENILTELDADKNDALATLSPLKAALGDATFNELIAKNDSYYDTVRQKVTDGENRINEIMEAASDQKRTLTQQEIDEISDIQSTMTETTVKHFSENEVEALAIMNRLKDSTTRVSLEQATEIIKNAKSTRDESISAAEKQYAQIQLEAQRMLDVGSINQTEYDNILKAAQSTRDDTISAANEQYDEIENTTRTKLGDTSKYINYETGEIKSKWEAFCDETSKKWSNKWSEIKTAAQNKWNEVVNFFKVALPEWWNKTVAPWFTLQKWLDLFKVIKDAIKKKWDEMVLQWKIDIQNWWDNNVAKWFKFETWKQLGKDAIEGLFGGLGDLWQKGKDLGAKFLSGFRSKDGIDSHSPSRAFKKAGVDIVSGLMIPLSDGSKIGSAFAKNLVTGFAENVGGFTDVMSDVAKDVEKAFDGISYNPSVDYSELIAAAEKSGDLASAANFEQIRNAKISGERLGYDKTYKYNEEILLNSEETNDWLNSMYDEQVVDNETGAKAFADYTKQFTSSVKEVTGDMQSLNAKSWSIFTELFNKTLAKLDGVIAAVNNVRINITYNTYYTLGKAKCARGGMLDNGQLFEAGEYGKAELLGSYGGKTTVMPLENSDFISAMYDAMYNAVSAAGGSGQVIENVLNLDGNVIYRNQQKVSKAKGTQFATPAFQR